MSSRPKNPQRLESFRLESKQPKTGFFSSLFRKVVGASLNPSDVSSLQTSPTPSETDGESDYATEPPSPPHETETLKIEPVKEQPSDSEPSNNLLGRIRSIRATGINKDYWMKDEKVGDLIQVKECYDCKLPFSTFRRRHHWSLD